MSVRKGVITLADQDSQRQASSLAFGGLSVNLLDMSPQRQLSECNSELSEEGGYGHEI
jgi:hypothetical protein